MIHVVYRSSAAENRRSRPDFFDKETAPASFLRAAREAAAADTRRWMESGPD
jgi:hypothetical protein